MKWYSLIAYVLLGLSLQANSNSRPTSPPKAHSETAAWPGSWPAQPGELPMRGTLGMTREGQPVEAWYFPGKTDKRALVLAGVHGSELAAIYLAKMLINDLQQGFQPDYTVIVVPVLFPDNARLALEDVKEIGSLKNIGRLSAGALADPNRQMPTPGQAYQQRIAIDHQGRIIERENQYLLELIQQFRPERIASLHAIRNEKQAGFFADPRTDAYGISVGFEADSLLVMGMANWAAARGYRPAGNFRNGKATAHYFLDPPPVGAGLKQPRNTKGSWQPAGKGQGISLGTWCSTAIAWEPQEQLNRPAIPIITVECPGSRRPDDYASSVQWERLTQLRAYLSALELGFLKNSESDFNHVN